VWVLAAVGKILRLGWTSGASESILPADQLCAHSSMDRASASEAEYLGSSPDGRTTLLFFPASAPVCICYGVICTDTRPAPICDRLVDLLRPQSQLLATACARPMATPPCAALLSAFALRATVHSFAQWPTPQPSPAGKHTQNSREDKLLLQISSFLPH
jgi:hypothetical protein